MSDIRCVVCGEPWDAYGITHGDMAPWEAKLFRAGAGCPCCEGEPNGWTPEKISDVENGDEDPMVRIMQAEAVSEGKAPKWERPEDPVHWTCDSCGNSVVTDLDTGELAWARYRAFGWSQEPTEEPEHTFTSGTCVCCDCYQTCDHCGEPVEPGEESYYIQSCNVTLCSEDCLCSWEHEESQRVWRECYRTKDRLEYVRDHRDQFDFRSFAEMLACVRGHFFAGYASELLN